MKIKIALRKEKAPKETLMVEFAERADIKFATDKNGSEKLVFGIGKKRSEVNLRDFFVLCRKLIRTAKSYKVKKLGLKFEDFNFPKIKLDAGQKARIIAEQFAIANFDFDKYKKTKELVSVEEIFVQHQVSHKSLQKEFEKGLLVGEEVNKARELSNTPGGDMTPGLLAEEARKAAKGTKIKVSVLDEKKIRTLKMGAILGVSRGSHEKPRFIVMEYWGARGGKPAKILQDKTYAGKEKPVILVGKGVTFDTGGLSLKPSDGMLGMHLDMSGGAVVIHTIAAIAKLGLKKNVIGLVPAVENMPSGGSYRPGDILKTMSGKTVEVLNTDAEGRLILADALTYAEKYNPKLVIDVATLTGAAVVALGERCSAIFSKEQKLLESIIKHGEEAGEYVWPLPLWEEYEEDVKGYFADLSNVHKDNLRWGGAIEAAVFLYQFAKSYPWVHIDMAPRMVATKSDYLARGSTGEPLKLLVRLIENSSS